MKAKKNYFFVVTSVAMFIRPVSFFFGQLGFKEIFTISLSGSVHFSIRVIFSLFYLDPGLSWLTKFSKNIIRFFSYYLVALKISLLVS